METVSCIFDEGDAAVQAVEQAREAIRTRSTVSVFLPRGARVLKADALTDAKSIPAVAIVSAAVGAVGALTLATLGAPLSYVLVWLVWALVGGLMLGFWLTGQMYRTKTMRILREASSRLAREVQAGHAVVVAVVDSVDEAHRVEHVFESAGGTLAPAQPSTPSQASSRP